MSDYGKVHKGFDSITKRIKNKGRYIADCSSCDYYYSDKGKTGEYCHNNSVSKFDMCFDDENGRVFCTYWIDVGNNRRNE